MTTEESFDLFMSRQCNQNEDYAVESEGDSDRDDLTSGNDAPTTFRMLLENVADSDSEFIDRCQEGKLIMQNPSCPNCCAAMVLVEGPQILDGLEWRCPNCSYRQSVRHGSWYGESDIEQYRLKDIILILYCWSRNYSELDCQHELESFEPRAVPLVYSKCHKIIMKYFIHEICSIGFEKERTVEIEEFRTSSGIHMIGGVEKKNTKKVFFRILPENWTRNNLVTAIIDNLNPRTVIHINKTLHEILDKDGIQFLGNMWKLKVETSQDEENTLVKSLWTVFEKQHFVNLDITEYNLKEFLFRRRMAAHKDPFLFLLSVINILHPISYSNKCT